MSTERAREIFTANLRYYMELNNKKQKDLVLDLGYSSAIISNWCTGQKLPRMEKIEQLARYFNIEASNLLEKQVSLSDSDPQISELLNICKGLTAEGLQRLIDYADELSLIAKYQKESAIERESIPG